MDPQTKGMILGGLSSAAALTLGYIVQRTLGGGNKENAPEPQPRAAEEVKDFAVPASHPE